MCVFDSNALHDLVCETNKNGSELRSTSEPIAVAPWNLPQICSNSLAHAFLRRSHSSRIILLRDIETSLRVRASRCDACPRPGDAALDIPASIHQSNHVSLTLSATSIFFSIITSFFAFHLQGKTRFHSSISNTERSKKRRCENRLAVVANYWILQVCFEKENFLKSQERLVQHRVSPSAIALMHFGSVMSQATARHETLVWLQTNFLVFRFRKPLVKQLALRFRLMHDRTVSEHWVVCLLTRFAACRQVQLRARSWVGKTRFQHKEVKPKLNEFIQLQCHAQRKLGSLCRQSFACNEMRVILPGYPCQIVLFFPKKRKGKRELEMKLWEESLIQFIPGAVSLIGVTNSSVHSLACLVGNKCNVKGVTPLRFLPATNFASLRPRANLRLLLGSSLKDEFYCRFQLIRSKLSFLVTTQSRISYNSKLLQCSLQLPVCFRSTGLSFHMVYVLEVQGIECDVHCLSRSAGGCRVGRAFRLFVSTIFHIRSLQQLKLYIYLILILNKLQSKSFTSNCKKIKRKMNLLSSVAVSTFFALLFVRISINSEYVLNCFFVMPFFW